MGASRFIFILVLTLSSIGSFCQDTPISNNGISGNSSFGSGKFFTGGGLGFQFGRVTMVQLSPVIGYRITDYLSIAAGPEYIYLADHLNSFNAYGGRIFSRYYFIENAFIQAEEGILSGKWNTEEERTFYENTLLGGGYQQALAGNSFFVLSALWNVRRFDITQPVIRGGIVVGL